MRVMVFGMATESSEQGEPPSMEAFEAMERFNDELTRAGILVAGACLHPASKSKRVLFDGPRRTVIDGPFTETKEVIAGFSIWEVRDMDEAIDWVKRSPNAMPGPSQIEIRPFIEFGDMAEMLGPEAREKLGVA